MSGPNPPASMRPEQSVRCSVPMRHAILACLLLASSTSSAQEVGARFVEATPAAGIEFLHENGATPEKYMPETMGAGALIFDYDNDGWPDLFFVNGGSFVDEERAAGARHRLYRNDGDLSFTDASAESGIGVSGFGMGACAADYDNDGWPDLYLTSVGPNRLYRNLEGEGFQDVTGAAGVGTGLWSSSCAFADVDNDGHLDLYVVNYVDFAPDNNKYCGHASILTGETIRAYCHPDVYNGVADALYHNNGDGTFTDIGREAGIHRDAGKGLGVVFSDYDADGWIDIYVANDSVANFLFHNKGDGTFEELGLLAGVAVGSDGQPLAGMGTDMADIDGDGMVDVFVSNLDRQTHNVYRNQGLGFFEDVTYDSGVGVATMPFVGFGAVFFDYDNDTDLDLAIANGDVTDNVALFRGGTTHAQRNLLMSNDGTGRFTDVGPEAGGGFALEKVSRALATGDLDNDGDLDIVIANNGQGADLLRNDGGNRGNALLVRTVGSESNLDGVGARLELWLGRQRLVRTVKAGSSYLGQNDLRVHFGLGPHTRADRLEITWPGGARDVIEGVEANQILTVTEGLGPTRSMPFSR
jgi:hypothetical protein